MGPDGCSCATTVPVMIRFLNLTGSQGSFHISEVDKTSRLGSVLQKEGEESWTADDSNIQVRVSSSRSGSFDKFSLTNSVSLVSRILKTDVIWVQYEKIATPNNLPLKNAFELLKVASKVKALPDKITNPINQKQELFNEVIKFLSDQEVLFSKSDCAPRLKNRKTGLATELVYEITDIVWKIGLAEKQLTSSGMWSKVPGVISKLATFKQKSKEPIRITQLSAKNFSTVLRETASKALMANPKLAELKLAMLTCADIFWKYSEYLEKHLDLVKSKAIKERSVKSAVEAVILQINNREKVTLIDTGSKNLTNPVVQKIFQLMGESYKPVNISTILPANRISRSTILHRDLPNQAPERIVVWTFDNGSISPQSIFAFKVDLDLDRANQFFKT